jgi:hypothetical protein
LSSTAWGYGGYGFVQVATQKVGFPFCCLLDDNLQFRIYCSGTGTSIYVYIHDLWGSGDY